MNALEMVASALKRRGTGPIVAWLGLCGATILLYLALGNEPLGASNAAELTGMAFVNAMVVFAGWWTAERIRRWRGHAAVSPSPAERGPHDATKQR